jgi:Interferon-induced transmembrane protein.
VSSHGSTAYFPENLVWAIPTTLFCRLPPGSQVDGKRAAGDIAGAREASAKARFRAVCSAG